MAPTPLRGRPNQRHSRRRSKQHCQRYTSASIAILCRHLYAVLSPSPTHVHPDSIRQTALYMPPCTRASSSPTDPPRETLKTPEPPFWMTMTCTTRKFVTGSPPASNYTKDGMVPYAQRCSLNPCKKLYKRRKHIKRI